MCPCECLCVCACLPLCKRLCDFRFALLFTIEWLVRYAMLMLRVRCSGEMMMEDRSVDCHSIAHSTYIGLTIVLTAIVSAITLRLSSVSFELQLIEVKSGNPFDMSGECAAKDRPQEHPFTLKDLMYEQITVFVKLMMSVSQHLISGDLVLSMLLFFCSSLLTLTGFA